jgi:hypothetical protein
MILPISLNYYRLIFSTIYSNLNSFSMDFNVLLLLFYSIALFVLLDCCDECSFISLFVLSVVGSVWISYIYILWNYVLSLHIYNTVYSMLLILIGILFIFPCLLLVTWLHLVDLCIVLIIIRFYLWLPNGNGRFLWKIIPSRTSLIQ